MGRDTVNEAGKVITGVIKIASIEIKSIAQQRINQIIIKVGKEVERVLSKILRRAIEELMSTRHRLDYLELLEKSN